MRDRELGHWRWKAIFVTTCALGSRQWKCLIRYTYGSCCLCSRRQQLRPASLLLMLRAWESNKAHSLCFTKQWASSGCFFKGCVWALSAGWAEVYPVSTSPVSRPWQEHVSSLSEWQDFRAPCWQSQSIFLLLPSWNNFGTACWGKWKQPWWLRSFLREGGALIANSLFPYGNPDEGMLGRGPKTSGLIYGGSGRPSHRTAQCTPLINSLNTMSLKEI